LILKHLRGKLINTIFTEGVTYLYNPLFFLPRFVVRKGYFLPGTFSFSIATVGCNFRCLHCQNWEISQASKDPKLGHKIKILGKDWPPEKIVREALRTGCKSIAYTYTEPTIFFEYALDTMKLAHKKGLKNCWISNGYFSKQTLEKIASYLDAINIDLKCFSEKNYQKYTGAKLKPVLENIKAIHKKKIHLEITTLIIPTINDSEKELKKEVQFIASIDKNIPWHISSFFPAYKMTDLPPTPRETFQKAKQIGKKAGLKNVYLGNI